MTNRATETKLTLTSVLRNLTLPQLWGVGAALLTLVGGSVGVGAWGQAAQEGQKLAEKDRTIASLDGRVNTLNGQLEELQRNYDRAESK